MDHISVPLAQIQASLDLVRRGLIDHEPCDPEALDRAVSTLSCSHDQVGGETRRLLYALFAASRDDASSDELTEAVGCLARRVQEQRAPVAATQLELFALDDDQQ